MFKILRTAAIVSTTLLSVTALSPVVQASQESAQVSPSVCRLYNLSGYSVIDAEGHLVVLADYCHSQTTRVQPIQPEIRESKGKFWQAFTTVADREAIAFANRLKQDEVVAYGSTICPFLEQGVIRRTEANLSQRQYSSHR